MILLGLQGSHAFPDYTPFLFVGFGFVWITALMLDGFPLKCPDQIIRGIGVVGTTIGIILFTSAIQETISIDATSVIIIATSGFVLLSCIRLIFFHWKK